jgi:hypothetical protein
MEDAATGRQMLDRRRRGLWRSGFAVRVDWSRRGHELRLWRVSRAQAERALVSDRNFWQHSPVRPVAWCVVEVSRRDVDLHRGRPGCQSPDCPTAVDTVVGVMR